MTVTALSGSAPDGSPATFTWQVDTRAPDTQLTRTNTFSTRSTGATFNIARTFASGDPGFVGRFDCQLDGGVWEPCDTPKTYLRLPPGHRTLQVKTTDVAGNEDVTPAADAWDIGPIQVFGNSPDTRWPEISEGTEVRDIVPDGSGGWFVGGDFTKVRDALGEHNHTDLVHIKSNMTVNNAWNPETNGSVRALGLSPDRTTLYIGGTFTTAKGTNGGSTPRGRLAAVSVATGDLNGWNPDASNDVNALVVPPVTSLASPVTTLYVAGAFQLFKATGPPVRPMRRKLAEIPLTGDGTPTAWNPNVDIGATLYTLAVTERHVYAGGTMSTIGGTPSSNPVVSRKNLVAVDRFDGRATSWAPNPNNQVLSLELRNRAGGSGHHLRGRELLLHRVARGTAGRRSRAQPERHRQRGGLESCPGHGRRAGHRAHVRIVRVPVSAGRDQRPGVRDAHGRWFRFGPGDRIDTGHAEPARPDRPRHGARARLEPEPERDCLGDGLLAVTGCRQHRGLAATTR